MTNKEVAFKLLAVKDSLNLHKETVNLLITLAGKDKDLFTYHAKIILETIFETLNNEATALDELAAILLEVVRA